MVTDIYHEWRGDLQLNSTGDIRSTSGSARVQQHVLRRLLTARGGYIWHPTYGVGLGILVGQPIDIRAVEATVRLQLAQEPAIAVDPPPEVRAAAGRAQVPGSYAIAVKYHDAVDGTIQSLSVPTGI